MLGTVALADKRAVWCDDETLGQWEERSQSAVVNRTENTEIPVRPVVPDGQELELVDRAGVPATLECVLGAEKTLEFGVPTPPLPFEVRREDRLGFFFVQRASKIAALRPTAEPGACRRDTRR